ncbi:MAG TPA: CDP-diacylglycerol--serine O-phosphatidyltransferase [Mesorhizobium sp.]
MARPFQPFEPHGSGGPRIGEIPLRMLVPNFITVLAICAGLSGIRLAFEGRFEIAVVLVLVAAFLDGIDGRIARALKATSKFGVQMDSLADIVNFGVAPALVLYFYLLHFAKPLGWIAALIYAVACCLRLARFNVMAEDATRPAWQAEYFVGVPAPAGAGLVMLPVYLSFIGLEQSRALAYCSAAYVVLVAFLLVSRLPVYSGKRIRMSRHMALPWLFLAVVFVLFLSTYTWETLAVTAIAYLVLLPVGAKGYGKMASAEAANLLKEADGTEPQNGKSPG